MNESIKKAKRPSQTGLQVLASKNRRSKSSEPAKKKIKGSQTFEEITIKQELKQSKLELQRARQSLKQTIDKNKIAEEIHEQRRKILEEVISCAGGPVFSVDKRYCYTSFNQHHAKTMKELYGAKIEIGKNLLDYHTNSEDRAQAKKNIDRALKGETVLVDSYAGDVANTRRFFEITHYPVKGSNNKVNGVTIYARDITELKTREEENERITRTIKTLSNSNQAMMRATNETEFMAEVCRNIENDCGYAMVWIGLAENDKNKSVRPVISAGFEDGYLETVRISWADNERGRGPTGTAIRTGKVSLCRNMLTDPKFTPWRKEAIKHGYASSIALPLIAGDKPFGALTIYSKIPDPFAKDEIKLLAELASDLAYGITAFKLRTEQARAERALRESEEQLRHANELLETVTEGTGVIIATVDTTLHYTYFNQPYKEEIKRLTGKDIQIGSNMVEVFAELPEQQEIAVKEWTEVLQGNQSSNILEFGDPARYRRIYNIRHTPLRGSGGNIIGAGEVAYDITEQEQAKMALVESETRYQSLFNRMTEGFALHEIICDEDNLPCDYRFLDVNPAFERLTGLKREDIIGKCISNIPQLQGDDPKWIEIYGKVALTGEPVQFDNYSSALKRHYAVQAFQPEPGQFAIIFQDVSERKLLEDVQNWLASFPERNPTPVVEVDFSGSVHYLNPAAQKLFPDLAVKGREHPYLVVLDSALKDFQEGNAQTTIRDVQIGEKYYRQTLTCISEIKRVRIYCMDISARVKAEGALRQARDELEKRVHERTQELVATNENLKREIAERKRAELALRESEDRYRTLFETSPDAVMLVDINNKIIFANQRAASMHGYRNPKTLAGMDVSTLIAPKDNERVRQTILNTVEQGALRDIEYQILMKDGSQFPAELNVSLVRSDNGHPAGYLMDVRDITERKWAEESLRQAYAYNRSLIEASLDPLVTITPEGKIGDVNSATEAVTGYSRDVLIGTDFTNYFVDPEKARVGYQKMFESGTVRDYNLEIRNKDGSLTPVVYNASVYRDETGKVNGIFAAARDITERNRFETQLIQAEKHAIIGRMVGSITHEINNPLQTIKNCLYLIQQDVTPGSPIQEPLEMAASETLRLTNLVGHLRELYRPKVGINKQSNEVLDIIEEVHSLLIPHLNSAKVQWQPLSGLQRCYVECMRDQILEVFLNISMNAIEAMQNTGGTLFVDMIKSEDRTAVIFKDTGPGIPEEIARHIFEPFMTTKASGLGLGLSISYGIVQRHGGQILMENQPGQGATFTIWLPQTSPNADGEVIKHGNE
jgi:PAS domain S-box-containing protein